MAIMVIVLEKLSPWRKAVKHNWNGDDGEGNDHQGLCFVPGTRAGKWYVKRTCLARVSGAMPRL